MSSKALSTIVIEKQGLKFSSAHLTIFPDGSQERLHGHNYQVRLELKTERLPAGQMIPFSVLKTELKRLCDAWDEYVLLPAHSPFLKRGEAGPDTNENFCIGPNYYSLPKSEVIWLDCETISCERLSEVFLREFHAAVAPSIDVFPWRELSIQVLESPHQGATATHVRH